MDVAAPKVFATSLATQMDHVCFSIHLCCAPNPLTLRSQAVESVLNRWSVKVVEPASQVPVSPLPPLSEPTVQMAGVVDSCHDTPYPVPNSPVRLNRQHFLFILLITPGERYFDCCFFSSHRFRTFPSFPHLQRTKIVTLDVPYS